MADWVLAPDDHREKAKRNKEVESELCQAAFECRDWRCVVIAYTALHEVHEYLKRKDPRVRGSVKVQMDLARHKPLADHLRKYHPDIWTEYGPLQMAGTTVRYGKKLFADLQADQIDSQLLPHLKALETLLTKP